VRPLSTEPREYGSKTGFSTAVPGHPDALVLSALAASAAAHIGRCGAVLQVIPTGLPSGRLPAQQPKSCQFGKSLQTWLDVRPRSRIAVLNGVPA